MLDAGCWMLDAGGMNGEDEYRVFEDEGEWGGYKRLRVYQAAHGLGVELRHFSLKLPKFELYETGSQLRRAAKSISANLVEGYGRRAYKADFIRFLTYSLASCDETSEWLAYIKDCHEDLAESADGFLPRIEEIGRQLNRFREAVIAQHRTS